MSKIRTILLLALLPFLWNCKKDTNNSADTQVGTSTTVQNIAPPTELSAPTGDKLGEEDLQALAATGQIKEACQLVSADWIKANFPQFRDLELRLLSRTSPDGNASACQCVHSDEATNTNAFVIGYRVSAGNMLYLQSLLDKGMEKDYAGDVPPYQEVRGLGQKAAFSRYNGNLAWVTEKGLYIYMYLYPQSQEKMKSQFNLLYEAAPQIDALANKFSG
ncbi:MAG: hypothetical protein AAF849_02915 [Bacteroidota bacterium]